jgi:hypothetical protein
MGLHRILAVASAAALSLLLVSACGGGDDAGSASDAGTPTADTVPAPSAGTAPAPAAPTRPPVPVTQNEIPSDFPEDIPTFPTAKPETSVLIPGKGGLVTFSSASEVAEIISFYKQALEEQGWTIENVNEADLRTRITATKDGRTTDVVAARNDESTEILLSIQEAG